MDSQRVGGQRRMGEVLIQGEDGQRFLPGSVEVFEGVPAQQVLQKFEANSESYLDYFVFEEPSPDPDHPEKNVVFVVATDASSYERPKAESPSSIHLFSPNELRTLALMPGAAYVGVVDHAWKDPVRAVDVRVLVPPDRPLTPAQQKLADSFAERVRDAIGGEPAGVIEIQQAVKAALDDLGELCMGVVDTSITSIDDPEGKKGAKAVKVSIQILPAPEAITIEGVPEAVRRKVLAAIDSEMDAVFQDHPLLTSRKRGDLDGADETYKLVRRNEKGVISWRYPPLVPQPGGTVRDAIVGFIEGKSVGRVPDTIPGQPMPLPMPVFEKLIKKLNERLAEEPGIYEVSWDTAADGTVRIVAAHRDRPSYFFWGQAVENLKEQYGIDLSEEMRMLEGGTARWSSRQGVEFLERLQKKFRAAGRELLVDDPNFLSPISPTEAEIRFRHTELINPAKVTFTGDVDIEEIGGAARLAAIIGDAPLTRAELRERLLKVEEHYHGAGYLIAGENPDRKEGLQIALVPKGKDGSVRVIVRVARMGKVRVAGRLPKASKEALATAIQSPEGEPLRVKEFMRNARRAVIRLELELEEKHPPAFVMRPDGVMDVLMNVRSPFDNYQAGIGTDGHTLITAGSATINHVVPGTTHVGVDARLGYGTYGGNLFVKTLPLNDDGVFLVGSAGYLHGRYWYREDPSSLEEEGTFHRGRGQLTVHFPFGGQGIASPFDLSVGARGTVVRRDGTAADGTGVHKETYYVGNEVGLSSIHGSVFAEDDLFKTGFSVGLDHNTTDARGDTTVSGSVSYAIPLGEYLTMEASVSAAKRLAVYGGDLPPERYLGEGNTPLINFGRSFGDPYGATYFWHSGLFVVLTHNRYLQPMVGTTVASDGRGGAHGGAGVAVRIPLVGLSIYLGADQRGRPTWGFGAGGALEF